MKIFCLASNSEFKTPNQIAYNWYKNLLNSWLKASGRWIHSLINLGRSSRIQEVLDCVLGPNCGALYVAMCVDNQLSHLYWALDALWTVLLYTGKPVDSCWNPFTHKERLVKEITHREHYRHLLHSCARKGSIEAGLAGETFGLIDSLPIENERQDITNLGMHEAVCVWLVIRACPSEWWRCMGT